MKRRTFLKNSGIFAIGTVASPLLPFNLLEDQLFFKISLAQWSLHRTIRSGRLDNLDFPKKAKEDFDIHAVEYVNQFFADKAQDHSYLKELKNRSLGIGVQNVLIMIDGEGELGSTDEQLRKRAVQNHYKWVEAAQFLGCHSIRVNAGGEGSKEDIASAAQSSLHELASFAKDFQINIIVENHGGNSSHGDWLSGIIKRVNLPNCGTLPDFGNFYEYNRYKGVKEMMPFAKGVSAKTNKFDTHGNEETINYKKMLRIVKEANYSGHIGIEYEGSDSNEDEGIRKTKELLIKSAQAI